MEQQEDFNCLLQLHDEIKDFKTEVAQIILTNFFQDCSNNGHIKAKFSKISAYNCDSDPEILKRASLSSTATCAYTTGEYLSLWEETKQNDFNHVFFNPIAYWNHILTGLKESQNDPTQLIDQFSILNILSLLKKIELMIEKRRLNKSIGMGLSGTVNETTASIEEYLTNLADDKKKICHMVEALCNRFIENQFATLNRGIHPVTYYKFMTILEDWKADLSKDSKDEPNSSSATRLTKILEDKFKLKQLRRKYDDPAGWYFWFMDELYDKGKYELYRQISLFVAEDKTLFDVKKLVYSLLIVRHNGRFRNNKIVDKALEIISKEQYPTGLLPIGLIVNNDFVKANTEQVKIFEDRKVTTSPILSSFECFSDMLSCKEIRKDLKKNYNEFALAYYWAKKRIRKDSAKQAGSYLGWYPEYERAHIAESWVSAHILLFLKKYCEFLSEVISDLSLESLDARIIRKVETHQFCGTFGIGKYVDYMVDHEECRSALIFGPTGCGKSDVGKLLCSKMSAKTGDNWSYVELTPARFLSEGQANIMPRANEIFKRLSRIRKAVVFFKEVDVFQTNPGLENWFMADLISRCTSLGHYRNVKLVLASHVRCNNTTSTSKDPLIGVDLSLIRLGRLDLVVPMGAVDWLERLDMLRKVLQRTADFDSIREENNRLLGKKYSLIKEDLDKSTEGSTFAIKSYLQRTNYISHARLNQILEAIFLKNDPKLFEIFFGDDLITFEDFEENELKKFEELMVHRRLTEYIRLTLENTTQQKVQELIADNKFTVSPNLESSVSK